MDYSQIERKVSENGMKMEDLFKKIGMTSSGFYSMIRNQTMKVKTLEAIAEALNMKPGEFFGVKPEISEVAETRKENQLLRELLDCQKNYASALKEINELKKPVGYNFAQQSSPQLNEKK